MRSKLFWLIYGPRWSSLRSIGGSNLVRSSVLMPAFGYMLLLNDKVHGYLTITFDGRFLAFLPPVWRIWFLFYGSFAIAAGAIVYSVRCPGECKRYGDAFEMAKAEAEHHVSIRMYDYVERRAHRLHDALRGWHRVLFKSIEPPWAKDDFDELPEQQRMTNLLTYRYALLNLSRPASRHAVGALFGVGFVLVAVPVLVTFIQVTLVALSALFK